MIFPLLFLFLGRYVVACSQPNSFITVPIRINLIFAGSTPVFMREDWSLSKQHKFYEYLSRLVQYHALPFGSDESPIISRSHIVCSAVKYSLTYQMKLLKQSTAKTMDGVLSNILSKSTSMFMDSTLVADSFLKAISGDPIIAPEQYGVYNVLIYEAVTLAPQYGYRAEVGGTISTLGIASNNRFLFIDVGARPFFLGNPASLTPGEELMSHSSNMESYANFLHGIVANVIAPPASEKMNRFPKGTRIAYKLYMLDASAVVGRIAGVAGDSLANRKLGSSFDREVFLRILNSLFQREAVLRKQLSVEINAVNMEEDNVMALAVARAFSMKGLQLILSSEQLLKDILANSSHQAGYFVDSSFVTYVPMFLFSFADDSRITHFESREQLRAKVIRKQAIFMVENRLRDLKDDHLTTTSEAVKEVLQLFFGLSDESLSLVNGSAEKVPLIAQDLARRNVLTQEIDWSESTALWKAVKLLNFEGLDRRLIPHEEGTDMAEKRRSVKDGLRKLKAAWEAAASDLAIDNIETATLELLDRSKILANKLHKEICNQPLPEEILLKAEVEMEEEDEKSPKSRNRASVSYFTWVLTPAFLGILLGVYLQLRSRTRLRSRGALLDDISATAVRGLDVAATTTTQWFSTMTVSDKSKTH